MKRRIRTKNRLLRMSCAGGKKEGLWGGGGATSAEKGGKE
jgi:hypothetical protein